MLLFCYLITEIKMKFKGEAEMLRQFLFGGNYLLTIFDGSLVIKTRIRMLILHVIQYSLQCWRSGLFFTSSWLRLPLKGPAPGSIFIISVTSPFFGSL